MSFCNNDDSSTDINKIKNTVSSLGFQLLQFAKIWYNLLSDDHMLYSRSKVTAGNVSMVSVGNLQLKFVLRI